MILGTDIEVFVLQDGEPLNACGIVQGSKETPYKWTEEEGYLTSLDCVAIEFNTPPVNNKKDFKESIQKSLKYIQSLLTENQTICFNPSLNFDRNQLYTIESITFGCSPDYNAWTNKVNKIQAAEDTTIRSIGTHLHLDCKEEDRLRLIRLLDLTLGIPALVFEPENERRTLYGKAGAFRPVAYGIEYRHLSGWFAQPRYLDFVWDGAELAMYMLEKGLDAPKSVKRIIDSNNVESAKTMISKHNLLNTSLTNLYDTSGQGRETFNEGSLRRNDA